MSLMNDALRKKKKELKLPTDTDMFKDDSGKIFKSRIRIYGSAALGVIVCALAGFYLYEFISISQPVKPVRPSVSVVEKQASQSGQPSAVPTPSGTEAPGQDIPAETITSTQMPAQKNSITDSETDKSTPAPSDAPMQATAKHSPPKMPPSSNNSGNTPSLPVIEPGEISRQPAAAPDDALAPPSEAVAPIAAGADSPAERFYRKGLSYHRQNRLEMAIQMYQAVLKNNPDHRAARFNLASAYIQVGAFVEARTLLQELDREEPGNPEILLNLAIVEIGLDRPEQALGFLDEAGRGNTVPVFEILFHRGVAYSRMENYEKALSLYEEAGRLAPGHTRLWLNKAVVLDSLARYGQAVECYQTFLDKSIALPAAEQRKIELRTIELQTYMAQAAARTAESPQSETEP